VSKTNKLQKFLSILNRPFFEYFELTMIIIISIGFVNYLYSIYCQIQICNQKILTDYTYLTSFFLVIIPLISVYRIIYYFQTSYYNKKYNYLFYLANFNIVLCYLTFALFFKEFISLGELFLAENFFPFYLMLIGVLVTSLILLSEKSNWDKLPLFSQVRLGLMLIHLIIIITSPSIGAVSSFLFFTIILSAQPKN